MRMLLNSIKGMEQAARISVIEIYKKGDHSQRIRVIDPGETNPSPFYDSKLANFFYSVKGNV